MRVNIGGPAQVRVSFNVDAAARRVCGKYGYESLLVQTHNSDTEMSRADETSGESPLLRQAQSNIDACAPLAGRRAAAATMAGAGSLCHTTIGAPAHNAV
jgi:hypothetical protein